jgi:hypothetical protein
MKPIMQQQQEYNKKKGRSNASYLMQYAGLGMQLLVSLGLSVFLGMKTDQWLQLSFPLTVILFPLVVLTAIMIKIFKDTSRRNDQNR